MVFALLVGSCRPARAQSAPQAIGIAVGGDNLTRLLWNNPDGSATLWQIAHDGSVATQSTHGPFGTYRATFLAAGPDSVLRILWNRGDGVVSLWHDVQGVTGLYNSEYTSPVGGTPLALAVDSSNTVKLLWSNTSGVAVLWQIASNASLTFFDDHPACTWEHSPGN